MKRAWLVVATVLFLASPAFADVTVTMSVSMGNATITIDSTVVTWVKGTKMRVETKAMNQEIILLADATTKQVWRVDHGTKQLLPYNPSEAMAQLPVDLGEVKVALTPNGRQKDVQGRSCEGYDLTMSAPMTINGEAVLTRMRGPVWIAKEGPGIAELRDQQKAFADLGMALSPLASGPQGKALMEAAKAMPASGVMMEQDITITMEGSGAMAGVLAQMGGMGMTTRITSIALDPISDDKFTAPEGYTKK